MLHFTEFIRMMIYFTVNYLILNTLGFHIVMGYVDNNKKIQKKHQFYPLRPNKHVECIFYCIKHFQTFFKPALFTSAGGLRLILVALLLVEYDIQAMLGPAYTVPQEVENAITLPKEETRVM